MFHGFDPLAVKILADALSDGVVVLDALGEVAYGNQQACRLLGADCDWIIGLPQQQLVRGYLGVSSTEFERVCAGEDIFCDAPVEGDFEALRLRRVYWPTPGGEPISALVIQDVRPTQQYRAAQETLARLRGEDMNRERSDVPLDGPAILRRLAGESRRARAHGEPLGVIVASGPAGRNFERWLSAGASILGGRIRVGSLEINWGCATPCEARSMMSDEERMEQTQVLPPTISERHRQHALVVAPGLSLTECAALAKRLSAAADHLRLDGFAFGTAAMRPGACGSQDNPRALLAWAWEELQMARFERSEAGLGANGAPHGESATSAA
jgi:hypothetical protein